MCSKIASRLTSHIHHHYLRRHSATATTAVFRHQYPHHHQQHLQHHNFSSSAVPKSGRTTISLWQSHPRLLSTRPYYRPHHQARPDIGARARQLQNRRLWTYALTFSCIAGFVVIVLNQFQDQLVFYVTPTDALAKYSENPSKSKFRLGGLVLEGSLMQVPSSPEMEFVITDLMTDMLVKYDGSLPDLFREGHSVVVEGFIRPFPKEENGEDEAVVEKGEANHLGKGYKVGEKARSESCYFKATEVLAKHDEKYMPQEVAMAIEKNKKILDQEQERKQQQEAETAGDGGHAGMQKL